MDHPDEARPPLTPAAAAGVPANSGPSADPTSGTSAQKKRIVVLLVEDDPLDRRRIQTVLNELEPNQNLTEVASYVEASSLLKEQEFDLAIIDHQLGDGLGIDLMEQLQNVAVIFMTSQDDQGLAITALERGAEGFLKKDVKNTYLEHLPVVIQNALRHQSARACAQAERAELERSHHELSHFAAMMTHDLKSPLRAIYTYANMLDDNVRERLEADDQDLLQRIQAAAQKMERFINDVFAYSQAGRNDEAQQEQAALQEVFQWACQNHSEDLSACEAVCTYEGPDCAIPMPAARALQVVQNLLSNACKFHRLGVPPIVKLSAESTPDEVIVSLQDNGIGMPEDGRTSIFKPFHRLSTPRRFEGSGIGLATCSRLVHAAGGTIEVHSILGEGTTFVIRFPAAEQTSP